MANDNFEALLNDIDSHQMTSVFSRGMNISEGEEESKSGAWDEGRKMDASPAPQKATIPIPHPSLRRNREWLEHPMHEELWSRKKGKRLSRSQLGHLKNIFQKYSHDRKMMGCYHLSRSSVQRILVMYEATPNFDPELICNPEPSRTDYQIIRSILEPIMRPPTYLISLLKLKTIVENETEMIYTTHRIRSVLK